MLPQAKGNELLDVGCGTGSFSIGMARRGYSVIGLSWDQRNNKVAQERAKMCGAHGARFEIQDVRALHQRKEFRGRFGVVVCTEVIEHILDDAKLIRDISACLLPRGVLLLTTPYKGYRAITSADNGPFSLEEDGGHVRRGYTFEEVGRLCEQAGLIVERRAFCSGVLSQKLTFVLRMVAKVSVFAAWVVILPFRWIPPVFDRFVTRVFDYPHFCICIVARKVDSPSACVQSTN